MFAKNLFMLPLREAPLESKANHKHHCYLVSNIRQLGCYLEIWHKSEHSLHKWEDTMHTWNSFNCINGKGKRILMEISSDTHFEVESGSQWGDVKISI